VFGIPLAGTRMDHPDLISREGVYWVLPFRLPLICNLLGKESESLAATNKFLKRKREKMEEKERVEDLVGPKPVGKEGLLEKKRAKRESDKTFREAKEDAGLEVSEDVLMGGNSSFKEAIARRDAARARWDAKKKTDPREQDRNERAEQLREKDRKTMEMFKQMAKERFG